MVLVLSTPKIFFSFEIKYKEEFFFSSPKELNCFHSQVRFKEPAGFPLSPWPLGCSGEFNSPSEEVNWPKYLEGSFPLPDIAHLIFLSYFSS